MKNFSAPKLLRLALTGTHISSCPHANDKIPGSECLCWKTEVRKWDARVKLASTSRVRKPKLQKIHLVGNHCASKSSHGLTTTSVTTDVTCKQCLKFANRPVKAPKVLKISKKQQKKLNKLAASTSLSVSP